MDGDRVDFFISYNKHDDKWATWIAWTLETAGYSTVLEVWDFRPGGNFALEMQSALVRSERMIAVLSPDYLKGIYASTEWAGVYATDPQGFDRRLVPVKVRECEPGGLLKPIIYIDIVGLPADVARARLLGGVSAARNKPLTVPAFPGGEGTGAPAIPDEPRWQSLTEPPEVVWRADTPAKRASGALIEVHLAPVGSLTRIEARRLRDLGDALIAMSRTYGLFTQTQAVEVMRNQSVVTVFDGTSTGGAGLLVSATGQRGGWVPLPQDMLGAVLDEADIATRVVGLLRVLADIDLAEPARVAVALGIEPATMVMLGNAADVGHRSGASLNIFSREKLRSEPVDSLTFDEIRDNAEEVSAELATRMVTAFATF